MTPVELYQAGQLNQAIEALNQEVKSRPSDPEARTFLFELLSFAGDMPRAGKQLDVIAKQNVESEWATQVYQNILEGERKRACLFDEGLPPDFFLDPPAYVQRQLEAVGQLREGNADQARQLFAEVEDQRPAVPGVANGQNIDDFRDCDDLFAPVLELLIMRDYTWVPLEQVTQIEISAPERPRDLIWVPVHLVLSDETERSGYLPTRYPGSAAHADDEIRLCRRTDWEEDAAGSVRGIGQRMFLAGDEGLPVLEARSITLNESVPRG
jgi:type VI secretion system protein ImpE